MCGFFANKELWKPSHQTQIENRKNKGEWMKEVKRKTREDEIHLSIEKGKSNQWNCLEREISPRTLYLPTMEKNISDQSTEKKASQKLGQKASGRLKRIVKPNIHYIPICTYWVEFEK